MLVEIMQQQEIVIEYFTVLERFPRSYVVKKHYKKLCLFALVLNLKIISSGQ